MSTAGRPSPRARLRRGPPSLGWIAVATAAVFAASPLANGYFDFTTWAIVALGLMVLLVVLLRFDWPALSRPALSAAAGLGLLLALSAASLLWAESKEAAWTDFNRLALYCVVFALVIFAVRQPRTARIVMMILGSGALLTSLWLCASVLLGAGQGAFNGRRLNAPIGYVNGNAGLLLMGLWPWLAYAETTTRRAARGAALAGASLIASTLVLTQARAVAPAAIAAAILVVICARGRVVRTINLGLLAASVACGLPWTLAVYSTGGSAQRALAPGQGLLRASVIAMLLCALGAGLARAALSRWDAPLGEAGSDRRRRLGLAVIITAALALVAGAAAATPWLAREYRSFTALRVNQNAAVRFTDASGFRYDLWRVALREFEARPAVGLGAGNYDVEYYRLRRNPEYVLQPHSLELQMAAELGVGGVIALLLFCGAILWACCARRGTLASEDRLVKVAATGMFCAWLAHTTVDWLYDIPGLTGMAIVAGAVLVLPAAGRLPRRARPRRGVVLCGLVVVALLAASVGRQYVATRYAQSGAAHLARSPRAAVPTLERAARLDPYSLTTLYALASAYAREDNYEAARAVLLAAGQREPHNYVPPALLGDLAVRRGDYRLAAVEYGRALSLNPREPHIRQARLDAIRDAAR